MTFLVFWSLDHIKLYLNLQERTGHHSDFFDFVWIEQLYTVLKLKEVVYAFVVVVYLLSPD